MVILPSHHYAIGLASHPFNLCATIIPKISQTDRIYLISQNTYCIAQYTPHLPIPRLCIPPNIQMYHTILRYVHNNASTKKQNKEIPHKSRNMIRVCNNLLWRQVWAVSLVGLLEVAHVHAVSGQLGHQLVLGDVINGGVPGQDPGLLVVGHPQGGA